MNGWKWRRNSFRSTEYGTQYAALPGAANEPLRDDRINSRECGDAIVKRIKIKVCLEAGMFHKKRIL